jgi:hypothetical protein
MKLFSVLDTNSDILTSPDSIYNLVLTANTVKSVTVPADAKYAFFAGTSNFWVCYTTTAQIPSSDITDGNGSEMNPKARYIYGVTTISLISSVASTVTILFYG